MKTQEKYKNIPHGELIKENGSITIPSIFMFNSIIEMKDFVHSCRMLKCTVYFKNEDMTVTPVDDGIIDTRLTSYGCVINFPKAAEDYIKYLFRKDDVTWDKAESNNA